MRAGGLNGAPSRTCAQCSIPPGLNRRGMSRRLRRKDGSLRNPFAGFKSATMLSALEQAQTSPARFPNIPVLLEGESGTGKAMVARRLHALSPRASVRTSTSSLPNSTIRFRELRVVRSYEGLVHRRARPSSRGIRIGAEWHDLLRRNRQSVPLRPTEAAACNRAR